MIGYLEGKLLKKEGDRILLLANQVGYEVLVPAVVMDTLKPKEPGSEISLYIYYQQTERQPKPVLIGFNLEVEKEFFQYFISVDAIGPLKAVKALCIPVREIARAIESKDADALTRLKGIGKRTAQKIIASLAGRMNKFALISKEDKEEVTTVQADFVQQVIDVLVDQLGHKQAYAMEMTAMAIKNNPSISSPEELFEEVYRNEKVS
ncbi:MAG: Holliday junction DNA helicase RuvA [Desulfosarcina sp.]|nr:Holliday junction DNA helicase RuvA [Desulfobacterales bacterium]